MTIFFSIIAFIITWISISLWIKFMSSSFERKWGNNFLYGIFALIAPLGMLLLHPLFIIIFPIVIFWLSYIFYNGSWWKRVILSVIVTVFWLLLAGLSSIGMQFIVNNYSSYVTVWESMTPAINQWDYMILKKNPKNIQRWDILVYTPSWKNLPFIKRVVGLPGEEISIENWVVSICEDDECAALKEDYLGEWIETKTICEISEFSLTTWYFMAWDNRPYSTDSRCCHSSSCTWDMNNSEINTDEIIWKVIFIK